MSDSIPPLNLPPLREHDFQSAVPVVGALIRSVRRGLYNLTAKWSTRALMRQQTDINVALAQHINLLTAQIKAMSVQVAERDGWLIDQDREVVALRRTVAELQAQIRWMAKHRQPITDNVSTESAQTEPGKHSG